MTKKAFGTKEWAKKSLNFIKGCAHDCLYCYAKEGAVRHKRATPETWKDEVVNEEKLNHRFRRRDGRIMVPTTHDITPDHLEENVRFLQHILKPGNRVLIVSKPHLECIERLCVELQEFKGNICFRFTIGSANSETLRYWEPNAPSFEERLAALQHAHAQGFQTSISCEPMIDDRVDAVVDAVSPFVTDTIWLGKGNMMVARVRMNGGTPEQVEAARALEDLMSDEFIRSLYDRYRENPMVKWKESLKEILGIPLAEETGLDI